MAAALPTAEKNLLKEYKRLADLPFDPGLRRNAVLVQKAQHQELIVRGAPEEILKLCDPASLKKSFGLEKWLSERGQQGQRVLAVAKTRLNRQALPESLENFEVKNLEFLGAMAFIDPIKTSTFSAVKQAEGLGLKIKILTGDSAEVAGSVAQQIKLIATDQSVITGQQFNALSAVHQAEAVEKYDVFARVSPEDKYKIIQLLQEKYQVGYLGEGINDAPALKIAGVSLVVQSASDLARESADIVLLKKNIQVIVNGIKEGRQVFTNFSIFSSIPSAFFTNTVKYIQATLASNFGNFYAVAIASLFVDFLPMLPVQILLLNLLSDFPMIAISADNIDKSELAQPKKYNVRDITLIATILGVVSSIFDFILFGIFFRFSPAVLQTNWFIASILTELAFLFSIRTKRLFFKAGRPAAGIIGLTGLAAIVTIVLPFTALGQNTFHFIRPSLSHLTLIFFVVAIYFATTESVKSLYYKTFGSTK